MQEATVQKTKDYLYTPHYEIGLNMVSWRQWNQGD